MTSVLSIKNIRERGRDTHDRFAVDIPIVDCATRSRSDFSGIWTEWYVMNHLSHNHSPEYFSDESYSPWINYWHQNPIVCYVFRYIGKVCLIESVLNRESTLSTQCVFAYLLIIMRLVLESVLILDSIERKSTEESDLGQLPGSYELDGEPVKCCLLASSKTNATWRYHRVFGLNNLALDIREWVMIV